MAGRPFPARDDREIAAAFHAGQSDEEIARTLGRTPKAIKMRRQRLGLLRETGHGHGEPWSVQEDERLRGLWHAGKSDVEIAHQLGRTRHSVKARRAVLRIIAVAGYSPDPYVAPDATEAPNDNEHVDAILAHGGFEAQAERARLWAEARRRGIAA